MKYQNIIKATFVTRPNRFIAYCKVEEQMVIAHVKNTGRCKELLVPGAVVYLEPANNSKRKTAYSLIGVKKGELLINIDSSAPNKVVFEALKKDSIVLPSLNEIIQIKQEATYQASRFDFYVETKNQKAFIEVKGVTLEEDGIAMFPDAPTERGIKHLEELIIAADNGFLSYIVFIIQMKGVKYFTPNNITHAMFGETLHKAVTSGVNAIAYDCYVAKDLIELADQVPIRV